ncbi:MAG TPA: carboxypeptidase-like regulatory domain-containing protein [Puia sp.]
MLRKNWPVISCFLLLATEGFGQQQVSGKVIRKGSAEKLIGVSIFNLNTRRYTSTDTAGNYSLAASPGDTVIFSSAAYLPDTAFVASYMFSENYLVALKPNIAILESVDVMEMGKYREDSLKRREEYSWLLDAKHPVKLMNEKRAADGPGFSFSPFGYFSKGERQKRRLKKRLKEEEEYYYVNYKFSSSRVSLLTGLKGDSLRMFMMRCRPSYACCRNATDRDMFLYINDKLILYKKGKL